MKFVSWFECKNPELWIDKFGLEVYIYKRNDKIITTIEKTKLIILEVKVASTI